MYMNCSGDSGRIFRIGDMTSPIKVTIFGKDLEVVKETTIEGVETIGLLMSKERPVANVRVAIPEENRDWGMAVVSPSINRSYFLMVEEVDEKKRQDKMLNRYFLFNSDANHKRYVLSSEPPHWLEARDVHFLAKYGKPSKEFPEKVMTLDEAMFYPLQKMKESLSIPGYSVEEAMDDAAEELLEMNVVCIDEDGPQDAKNLDDPEDYDNFMEEFTAARCSYADLVASIKLIVRADARKRYRERGGDASAPKGADAK